MDVHEQLPPRRRPPSDLAALWQASFLALLPAGGQRAARRNAWAGRSRDAAIARAWREAGAAVAAAEHVRAGHGTAAGGG